MNQQTTPQNCSNFNDDKYFPTIVSSTIQQQQYLQQNPKLKSAQQNENLNNNSYDQIVEEKEKELKNIQNSRIQKIEQRVQQKDIQLHMQQQKIEELAQECKFNAILNEQREVQKNVVEGKMLELKALLEDKQRQIEQIQANFKDNEEGYIQEIQKKNCQVQDLHALIQDLKQKGKFLKSQPKQEMETMRAEIKSLTQQLKQEQAVNIENGQNMERIVNERVKVMQNAHQLQIENLEQIIMNLKSDRERLQAEANKSLDRVLQENRSLIEEVNEKKKIIFERENAVISDISSLKIQIKEFQFANQCLEKELEVIKSANISWESTMREKIGQLQAENEGLRSKLISKKQKFQSQLKQLQQGKHNEFDDQLSEFQIKMQRLDRANRDQEILIEKMSLQDDHQAQKIRDYEKRLNEDVQDKQLKFQTLQRNFDEDRKKFNITNDILQQKVDILTKQNQQNSQEMVLLQKDLETERQSIAQLNNENKLLIQEVLNYRRNQPIKNSNNVQQLLQQQQNKQQNLVTAQPRSNSGGREIRETSKNANANVKQVASRNLQKEIFKVNSPQDNQINQSQFDYDNNQDNNNNLSLVFSEDQGPASLLKPGSSKFNQNTLTNNQSSPSQKMKQRFIQIEQQNTTLREENLRLETEIENMASEMQHIKQKVQYERDQHQHEMLMYKEEEWRLKGRNTELMQEVLLYKEKALHSTAQFASNNELQNDIIKLKTENTNMKTENSRLNSEKEQIQQLLQKSNLECVNLKKEIQKIKMERDRLVEISNDLRAKLRKVEVGGQPFLEYYDQNTKQMYSLNKEQSLQHMQELNQAILSLNQQIQKWQEAAGDKDRQVAKLREGIVSNNNNKNSITNEDHAFPFKKPKTNISIRQKSKNLINSDEKILDETAKKQQQSKVLQSVNLPQYLNFEDIQNVASSDQQNFLKQNLQQDEQQIMESNDNFQQDLNAIKIYNLSQKNSNIHSGLKVESQAKPMTYLPSAQNIKNSDKRTQSQKIVEERLAKKLKQPVQQSKVRNYNIVDDVGGGGGEIKKSVQQQMSQEQAQKDKIDYEHLQTIK